MNLQSKRVLLGIISVVALEFGCQAVSSDAPAKSNEIVSYSPTPVDDNKTQQIQSKDDLCEVPLPKDWKSLRKYSSQWQSTANKKYDVLAIAYKPRQEFLFELTNPQDDGSAKQQLRVEWVDEFLLNSKVFAYTVYSKPIDESAHARLSAFRCIDQAGNGLFHHVPAGDLRIPDWVLDLNND